MAPSAPCLAEHPVSGRSPSSSTLRRVFQRPARASRESRDRIQDEAFIESYRARVVSLQVPFKVTAVFVNRVVGARHGYGGTRIDDRNSQIAQLRESSEEAQKNGVPMARVHMAAPCG